MSMKKAVLLLALAGCVGFASSAGAITTDGDWADWFSWGGDPNAGPQGSGNDEDLNGNDWNGNAPDTFATGITYVGVPDGTTPGLGGQNYDIEAFMIFFDENTNRLHFAMVSGFNRDGADLGGAAGGPHYAGDVFFGIGDPLAQDYAVTVGYENTPENDGGTRTGKLFGNTGGWTLEGVNVPGNSAADPYRVDEDANGGADVTDFSVARDVQVAWSHNTRGATEHNFLEVSFLLDALEVANAKAGGLDLFVHWTMLCGNDVYNAQFEEPFAPVLPEPATLALMGMGLAGIAVRKRFFA